MTLTPGCVHRREEQQRSGHSGFDDLFDEPAPDGGAVALLLRRHPNEDAVATAFVGNERNVAGPGCSDAGKANFHPLARTFYKGLLRIKYKNFPKI
jgi:hypothetical protein